MAANITSVTPAGFVAWVDAQTAEEIVQVAATSFDPAGLVGAMDLVPHGITEALEASGTADTIAVVNIAIPPTVDKTKAMFVRTGFSTPSTTTTNEIDFSIKYVVLAEDSDTTAVADGEVFCACNPSAVANGYQFSNFELPAPGVGARVIELRLTRYGSTDSEGAVVNTLGIIASFTPIKE